MNISHKKMTVEQSSLESELLVLLGMDPEHIVIRRTKKQCLQELRPVIAALRDRGLSYEQIARALSLLPVDRALQVSADYVRKHAGTSQRKARRPAAALPAKTTVLSERHIPEPRSGIRPETQIPAQQNLEDL